jgi:hypothetical protein
MADSIAPPPELVLQWEHEWNTLGVRHPDATNTASYVAIRAAQWGADQELEACVQWMDWHWSGVKSRELRAARRPKPQSLKEQALAALEVVPKLVGFESERDTIRRALEALPDA